MLNIKSHFALLIALVILSGCDSSHSKIREIHCNYNKQQPNLYAKYFVVKFEGNKSIEVDNIIDSVFNALMNDSVFCNKINTISTVELWFVKDDKYIQGLDTIYSITDNTYLEHKEVIRKEIWFRGKPVR